MRERQRVPIAQAFTLVELMVSIAVIGVLVAILVPAMQSAREASRRVQCTNNLKQMSLALHQYHDAWKTFPAAYLDPLLARLKDPTVTKFSLGPGWAWGAAALPYLEGNTLYSAENLSLSYGDSAQRTVRQTSLAVFLCPSAGGSTDATLDLGYTEVSILGIAPSHYIASAGWIDASKADTVQGQIVGSGVFFPNSRVSMAGITDGTHETLMLGERSPNVASAVWSGVLNNPGAPLCTRAGWPVKSCVSEVFLSMGRTGPASNVVLGEVPGGETPGSQGAGADGFWSRHYGGCNFAFCDGSVRFVKASITPPIFRSIGSRNGGEVAGRDPY